MAKRDDNMVGVGQDGGLHVRKKVFHREDGATGVQENCIPRPDKRASVAGDHPFFLTIEGCSLREGKAQIVFIEAPCSSADPLQFSFSFQFYQVGPDGLPTDSQFIFKEAYGDGFLLGEELQNGMMSLGTKH